MSKNHKNRIFKFKDNTLELDVNLVSTRGFEKKRIIKQLVNELSSLLKYNKF